MRIRNLVGLFFLCSIAVAVPETCFGQSEPPPKPGSLNQDKVMQELLSEVRQLRLAIQRTSVNAYRGQVMLERLKLQQGQVNRMAQELEAVRNHINDLRSARVVLKQKLDGMEKAFDVGVLSEPQLTVAKAELDEINQREQGLTERESKLMTDLNQERATLDDLNRRLDTLEQEMVMEISTEPKPTRKRR
jgi:hypothetical protein